MNDEDVGGGNTMTTLAVTDPSMVAGKLSEQVTVPWLDCER
jgi:hypothetical protein